MIGHVSWVVAVTTYADPAQHLITAGEELDDLDHDLYDLDRDLYDLDRDLSDLSEVCII